MSKKICTICNVRPVAPASQLPAAGMPYCVPCCTQADWENMHSDFGHTEIMNATSHLELESLTRSELAQMIETLPIHGAAKGITSRTKKAEIIDLIRTRVADETRGCWICHPDLDETSAEYAPKGTSRKGMVVTAKGDVTTKSALVANALKNTSGVTAKIVTTKTGITTLVAKADGVEIEITWESDRYVTGRIAGKKVRNVAEALRVIAANFGSKS